MTEITTNYHDLQAPKRPFGVWLLTIYALIFAGIAPLLLSIFMLISGNSAGNTIGIFLSIALSIGIIKSTIGAWQGKEKFRKYLLILITINYVFIGLNNYLMINSGQVPSDLQNQVWGRVIRGILYPAVYIWYFNKFTTKKFYNP